MEAGFAPGGDDICGNGADGRAPIAANDGTAPGATAAVQLRFRVDEAIAGVERGRVVTIHEWAGAWSRHRSMRSGEHILIFLYPRSRLGLTSPVGGSLGQVALDASGKNVAKRRPAAVLGFGLRNESSQQPRVPGGVRGVSIVQLERAIRSARESELCAGEFWRLPVFFFVVLFSAALEGRPLSQARATLLESKDKR